MEPAPVQAVAEAREEAVDRAPRLGPAGNPSPVRTDKPHKLVAPVDGHPVIRARAVHTINEQRFHIRLHLHNAGLRSASAVQAEDRGATRRPGRSGIKGDDAATDRAEEKEGKADGNAGRFPLRVAQTEVFKLVRGFWNGPVLRHLCCRAALHNSGRRKGVDHAQARQDARDRPRAARRKVHKLQSLRRVSGSRANFAGLPPSCAGRSVRLRASRPWLPFRLDRLFRGAADCGHAGKVQALDQYFSVSGAASKMACSISAGKLHRSGDGVLGSRPESRSRTIPLDTPSRSRRSP